MQKFSLLRANSIIDGGSKNEQRVASENDAELLTERSFTKKGLVARSNEGSSETNGGESWSSSDAHQWANGLALVS